jgi:mRNA-degrading endonuclease RelE of RelBE toxin-antitoxin system
MAWSVRFSTNASKEYKKLRKNGIRPPINDAIDLLANELERDGPERYNWPNYDKLSENRYHCHLKRGRPTYVACWEVLNYKLKQIEIYYVGTHEGAPY